MQTKAKTLITGARLWKPASDGPSQTLQVSAYVGVAATDDSRHIAPVVASRVASVVGREGDEAIFSREPQTGGLKNASLAIPVFVHDEVVSVLELCLSDDERTLGAAEVWSVRPWKRELRVDSAYYPNLTRYKTISPFVNFPRGSGLPGRVWDSASVSLVSDVTADPSFLRAVPAEHDGLSACIAFPLVDMVQLRSIVMLVSGNGCPFAESVSIWCLDEGATETEALVVHASHEMAMANGTLDAAPEAGMVSISEAEQQAIKPYVQQAWEHMDPVLFEADGRCGVVVPVIVSGHVSSAIVMRW